VGNGGGVMPKIEKLMIAPFTEGFDKELEPWLIPEEAFVDMQDAFIRRGVLQKRFGYKQLATGGEGKAPATQSRVLTQTSSENKGVTDGAGNQTGQSLTNIPVSPGSVSLDVGSGGETISDNGDGTLTGSVAATGTINYITGAFTITGSLVASAVLATYSYPASLPVMGLFNYIDENSFRKFCALDTRNFNVYNTTTNTFDYVTHDTGRAFLGTDSDFWSFTNYVILTTAPPVFTRILVFTNGVDPIQYFDGTKIYDLNATSLPGVYVDPPASIGGAINTCKLVFYFGRRLCCLNVTQQGIKYPQRLLYSGDIEINKALDFSDPSAGVIEAPTDDEIMGAALINNSLVVFFKEGVWSLKTTQSEFFPFRWERLDVQGIARCDAPFSITSYFNEVTSAGKLGLIGTDGNRVFRVDNKLPYFTRDDIDPEYFKYCYGVESERNRQRWLTYKSPDKNTDHPNKILVNGAEENSWSTYTISMHSFGNFHEVGFDQAWDDFTDPWDSYGEPWDSYTSFKEALTVIGGDYLGYVFKMDTEDNDDHTEITGISQSAPAVVTVTNHRLETGDVVKVYDVAGMTEIIGLQSKVTVVDATSFQLNEIDSTAFTAYTSGGFFEKAIPFDVKTKPLNPWIKEDVKATLHWVDFRVDASSVSTCNIQFFTDERVVPYRLIENDTEIELYEEEPYGSTNVDGNANFYLENIPISHGTVKLDIGASSEIIEDDLYGNLTGNVAATGKVDYKTGAVTITGSIVSSDILADYEKDTSYLLLNFRDDSNRPIKWFRVYVNSTAYSHQIRLFQEEVDERLRIHAIRLAMSPAGTLESP